MKKRLLIIILFILFIPVVAKAENGVSIKSIEFIEKSNDTEIIDEASVVDNKINLNLSFYKLDDFIKYKVLVKNEDNKNLKIDDTSLINLNEYINYTVEYPDDDKVLAPGAEKELTITISYNNAVPNRAFRSAMYDASSNVNLLATDKPFISVLNTLKNISPIFLIVLLILILFAIKNIMKNKKNVNNFTAILLMLLIAIPFYVEALTEHNINLNSKITVFKIKDENPCTFDGEVVNNTQYINGQFTYTYISYYDGWKVTLTDKESTNPVNTRLCSKVNDKPIVDMSYMFQDSKTTSIDLSSFYTSNVINMEYMFNGLSSVTELDLSSFDTRNTTNLSYMFQNDTNITELFLRHFETDKVTNYKFMFGLDTKLETINLDKWNFNIDDVIGIFFGNNYVKNLSLKEVEYSLPVSDFYKNLVSRNSSPYYYQALSSVETLDVTGWDTSNETSFKNVLGSIGALKEVKGLETWDTSKVEDISGFLYSAAAIEELDLSSWDLSNVEVTGDYFMTYAKKFKPPKITSDTSIRLNRVYLDEDGNEVSDFDKTLDPDKWYYAASTLLPSSSFGNAIKSLTGQQMQNNVDTTIERIEREYDKDRFEAHKEGAAVVSERNVTNPVYVWVEDTIAYYYCESDYIYLNYESNGAFSKFEKLKYIDLDTFKTTNVNGMGDLFYGDKSLESVDVSNFDTSRAKYLQYVFANTGLRSLDLSSWDTSSATTISGLFYESRSLESVDISSFDTSNVTDMSSLFSYSHVRKVDISHFNTSKVTTMGSMFYKAWFVEEVKFGNFDTSNLTSVSYMFYEAINLKKIDMSSFDVSNATSSELLTSTYSLIEFITPKTKFKDVTTFVKPLYDSSNNEYLQFDANMPTTTKLTVKSKDAIFDNGSSVRSNLGSLPGIYGYNYSRFEHFKRSDTLGDINPNYSYYRLSAKTSPYPIFAWFSGEDNTIYYYTEGDKISLNANAYSMFSYLPGLQTIDLEDYDVSNTTDMGYLFKGSKNIKSLDLSRWNTSSVKYMNYMFYGLEELTSLDVSHFTTTTAIDMRSLFGYNYKLHSVDLRSFDFSNVTNHEYMFTYDFYGIRELYMPDNTGSINIRLPYLMKDDDGNRYTVFNSGETSKHLKSLYTITLNTCGGEVDQTSIIIDPDVSTLYGPLPTPTKEGNSFIGWYTTPTQGDKIEATTEFTLYRNQTIYANWQLPYSQLLTGSEIKSKMTSLAGSASNIKKILRETDSSKVPEDIANTSHTFSVNSSLKPIYAWYKDNTIYIYSEDTTIYANENSSSMFSGLNNLTEINLSMINTSKVTNMSELFKDCKSLVTLDISSLILNNVTNASSMFENCEKLSSINLAPFANNKITNASSLFKNCKALTTINLSSFNTSRVDSMTSMFEGCIGLTTIDLSVLNTSTVTSFSALFKDCKNLTSIVLTGIQTSNVKWFSEMFENCEGLTSIDVSGFNTSSAQGMARMFEGCINLASLSLSNFNTSNVSMMYQMFKNCKSLTTLNLSNFDTYSVTDAEAMFEGCINLETLNISSFVMNYNDSFSNMFKDCKKLKSVDISGFTYPWSSWGIYAMFENCESIEELDMSSMDFTYNDLDINILSGMTSLKTLVTPSGLGRSFKLPKQMYRQGDNTPITKLTSDMTLPITLKDQPW